jgi:Peptidase family M49
MTGLPSSMLAAAGLLAGATLLMAAPNDASEAARVQALAAQFAPVDLTADLSALPPNEKQALARMVDAARIMDALFLRQVSPGNESLLLQLVGDASPLGRARLHYFMINKGPWDRLDHDKPFVPGVGPKPPQANFYPAGATRAEVETWIRGLADPEREAANGFFTTIRRGAQGGFAAVPYSLEYQGELSQAAELLREAATLTQQPTLKAYLEKRAAAFLSNDYYDSDVAWMELDASIEPTIGPYETYEDGWFNFKAAFEAFIAVRDDAETAKLARFSAELQELEDHLPIEPRYRRHLGGLSPIRVVNVVFSSGDGNRGVQTAAYNLPNDERVVSKMGSKRVMLKNTQEAKFETTLVPIAKVALEARDQGYLSFDAFFTHILMHELMHGLGPQTLTVDGRETSVRHELKETYSTLEEAKADISGLWALQQLMDKGVIDKAQEKAIYTTFLASTFRTLRFGSAEAHGKGMALQINTLLDAGGFKVNADGTFAVDFARVKPAVAALTREIMTMEATGDYAKAKEVLATRVAIRPEVQKVFDRLSSVPIDIEPRFKTAEELTAH